MIRKLFLLSFLLSKLFSYEDLGTYGQTYENNDKDFRVLLKEKIEKVDTKKLEEELIKSSNQSLIIRSSINECKTTLTREFEPTIELKHDLLIPYTDEKIADKGQYNILKRFNINMPYNILFINADNELEVELAQYYKKELRQNIKIMVVKGDYLKFVHNPLFKDARVSRNHLENKAFNLKCLPSIYTQKNYKFIIQEYAIKDLMKEDKSNEQ